MISQPQIGISDMLKTHLELARTFLPRKRTEPVVTLGATFAPAPVEPPVTRVSTPLPPCRPLNPAEAKEAETLAKLRGALYPSEA